MRKSILIGALIWTSFSFATYPDAVNFLNNLPDQDAAAAKMLIDPDTQNTVVIYPFENPCCTGQINDGQCHYIVCPHNTLRK